MTNNIGIDDLGREIIKQLEQYGSLIEQELEVESEAVATELVQILKQNSPRGKRKEYYKGWKKKRKGKNWVVHNKTNYQLTHLLEHGHAKRNGGSTREIPHIRPAEEHAVADFLERIERIIENK